MAEYDPIEEKAKGTNYDPIIPKIRQWPIAKLSEEKDEFLNEVIDYALEKISAKHIAEDGLEQDIAKAYYGELQRIRKNPWRVDKKDEADFWNAIKKESNKIADSAETKEEVKKRFEQVSRIIIERYANEIVGNFKPGSYHFAKRFLSFGFASLLNAFQARNLKAVFDHKIYIQDRIKIIGHIEQIRNLAKKGTVVLVPTHFSNLDSIMIAWSIHAIGLPAFIYGAGLNLFNSRIVGYFMSRLGAYKLDRRKKNTFYLETLKAYSAIAIKRGAHSLFFPGGTRSRSGAIENQLKLGLLGTCFTAQEMLINEAEAKGEAPRKIFVVPLVMSYHFVLEAKSLMKQHLKKNQREQYFFARKDEYSSKRKVTSFILQLLRKRSDIFLSYGQPMDLFGNKVNEHGESVGPNNQVIDIKDYFLSDGKMRTDNQRDTVYTKTLGEEITKRYLKENIVLSSHLLAFAAYQILAKRHHSKDVYVLKEKNEEELVIYMEELKRVVRNLLDQLHKMHAAGELKLSKILSEEVEVVIEDGIKNAGLIHNNKPLIINKSGNVQSQDLELLYYYRNRLKGYSLERYI